MQQRFQIYEGPIKKEISQFSGGGKIYWGNYNVIMQTHRAAVYKQYLLWEGEPLAARIPMEMIHLFLVAKMSSI